MKQSERLATQHAQLRRQAIAEIMLLVRRHQTIEMEIEFTEPIFYGQAIDEQDSPPEIQEITEAGFAVIFYQGDEIEKVALERLSTEKLIEIVNGLEESLEEAKAFKNK